MFPALLCSPSGGFEHYVLIIRGSNSVIQHLVSSQDRLREDSLTLRTGRPPTGVTVLDAV